MDLWLAPLANRIKTHEKRASDTPVLLPFSIRYRCGISVADWEPVARLA
jgi:hypothetical protein